jgi:hypothetical protein
VSTALTASLTVPADELAGIVASRLLRAAVEQISAPDNGLESNRSFMEEFLDKAGLLPVFRRRSSDFAEPEPGVGARQVTAALNERREAMKVGIAQLRTHLGSIVPEMTSRFDPYHAVSDLLGRLDAFRVERVVCGHPALGDEAERSGATGLLHRRQDAPEAPPGQGNAPPAIPELHDGLFRREQYADKAVVDALNRQNQWYEWQTHLVWAQLWDGHAQQWQVPLEQVQRDLSALTRALTQFAKVDVEDFTRRAAELYRKRVGQSYLLPADDGRMEQFYHQAITRLRAQMARNGQINVNSSEADLVRALVGADTWPEAFKISVEQTPDHAVAYLREVMKTKIKTFLRQPPPGEQPLLPRLQDVLAAATGYGQHGTGTGLQHEYLDELSTKLAGLLPANFIPQGTGPLSVLISYPADTPDEVITSYLNASINLPRGPRTTLDYRNTRVDALTVVLFRTSMGVTEADEVRQVIRRWSSALSTPLPTDLLHWRQRTGYEIGYLATREHRVNILHRLLCALWNGRAAIQGTQESPEQLSITLDGGVTMRMTLTPLGQASSWGSLLRAYELWALDDDDLHRRFASQLMRELPNGIGSRPHLPHNLYRVVVDLAQEQIDLLNNMPTKETPAHRSRTEQTLSFWTTTLPAALTRQFTGIDAPIARDLSELKMEIDPDTSG